MVGMTRRSTHIGRAVLLLVSALLLASTPVRSQTETAPSEGSSITDLSIEDLMNIEVTSVSKRSESLSNSAAAVYVITEEDIRRSGFTSVVECLRMVPGLDVARVNGNIWAVASRGFNSRFSNKLLVLVDGRSIYSPLYAGVWWDELDMILADISRIEVIRGPGATLWGANAVNGIINIITKKADETQGAYGSALNATLDRSIFEMRQGGKAGSNGNFRIYAKSRVENNLMDSSGDPSQDSWSQTRGGFRYDRDLSDSDSLTVEGDVYSGDGDLSLFANELVAPLQPEVPADLTLRGSNLLTRWNRTSAAGAESSMQVYYERVDRNDQQHSEILSTYDLDFQHRAAGNGRHDLIWGLGYRYLNSDTTDTPWTIVDPKFRVHRLASSFIQDEITLEPGRKVLTVGSKFEYNDYTGFEVQPSARMSWTNPQHGTIWAAVSRAVRTPARGEVCASVGFRTLPGAPLTRLITLNGNENFKSEDVLSYEVGYRTKPTDKFSLDVAAFHSVYNNLRTGELGTPVVKMIPVPHVEVPLIWENKQDAKSFGLEIAANWQPKENWRLALGYTYLDVSTDLEPDSTATVVPEGYDRNTPPNQINLRSYLDLPGNRELDASLYYVQGFKHHDIPGYVRLDLRYGWRFKDGSELSVVGQNLLQDHHPEFYEVLSEVPSEVPRSVYISLSKSW